MDTDRNLLFGILAVKAKLLDPGCFVEACAAWASRRDIPLPELLVERGWLAAERQDEVDRLVANELAGRGAAGATTGHLGQPFAAGTKQDAGPTLEETTAPEDDPLATTGHAGSVGTTLPPDSGERYTLDRLHATGGIGRVWVARDRAVGREVALKELRPEWAGNNAAATRFLREAQVTGQLEHPSIVPIYELGRRSGDNQPFYAMRFIGGGTLARAVARYHKRRTRGEARPLELRDLLGAFVAVCNAVAYAHSRGVIHRDLKPQNVVLGEYGEVIVLDWGLAKLLAHPADADSAGMSVERKWCRPLVESQGEETIQGQVLGTPAYMAPEQAEGRVDLLGPTTDVYGLGAVLYEILTGRPPLSGGDLPSLLQRIVSEQPAAPCTQVASTPRALEAVCLKALAKNQADRYAGARELAADVQSWLADEPVSAFREPFLIRTGRWVKRRRVLVASTAAALLMALAGLAIVGVVQARSNRNLAQVNVQLERANQRESERFDLAMDAIGAFHTGVSKDVLLEQPQFKELRDRLLRSAAGFYDKLGKALQELPDDRSRQALGNAWFQLGDLTHQIGDRTEALRVHRLGLAVRRERAAAGDSDRAAVQDVVQSVLNVGFLQESAGDHTGARTAYEEALELAERGSTARDETLQAIAHDNLGRLLMAMGKPASALEACAKAKALRQKLVAADPSDAERQSDLANSFNSIAWMLEQTGKSRDALAAREKARDIFRKQSDRNPRVVDLLDSLSQTHGQIGVLLMQLGQAPAALAALEEGLKLRQKLVVRFPAVAQHQSNLAWSHSAIGNVQMQLSQQAAALNSFAEALRIRQQLVDANPNDVEMQHQLAQSHARIAKLQMDMGKASDALISHTRAMVIYHKLIGINPSITKFQSDLGVTHFNMGIVLWQTGRPADGLAEYRKAQAIFQKLADASPTITYFQSAVAQVHNNAASLLLQTGSPVEALAEYELSRIVRQKLADSNPNIPQYRNDVASSHTNCADALIALKRLDEARNSCARAIAIRDRLVKEYPNLPLYRNHLGCSLKRLALTQQLAGQLGESATAVRRAVKLFGGLPARTPETLVEMAGTQALLSALAGKSGSGVTNDEGKTAADSAMDLLRQAVAAGNRNRAGFRSDSCLDPLRQRSDFQKLMQDLETKTRRPGQESSASTRPSGGW